MKPESSPRTITLILLIVLFILLGLGGLGGGITMFADPSSESMGLPDGLLEGLPISSFILPGETRSPSKSFT